MDDTFTADHARTADYGKDQPLLAAFDLTGRVGASLSDAKGLVRMKRSPVRQVGYAPIVTGTKANGQRMDKLSTWVAEFDAFHARGTGADGTDYDALMSARGGNDILGSGACHSASFDDEFVVLSDAHSYLSLQGDALVDERLSTIPAGSVIFDIDAEDQALRASAGELCSRYQGLNDWDLLLPELVCPGHTAHTDDKIAAGPGTPDLSTSVGTVASDSADIPSPTVPCAGLQLAQAGHKDFGLEHMEGHNLQLAATRCKDHPTAESESDPAYYNGVILMADPRLLAIRRAMRSKKHMGGFFARSFDSLGEVRATDAGYAKPTMRGIKADRIRF